MPELSRFYGIIIRMFFEPMSRHHRPHFHAYYQGENASVSIDDEIEVIAGSLPKKQELVDNWELLQSGAQGFAIEPLK